MTVMTSLSNAAPARTTPSSSASWFGGNMTVGRLGLIGCLLVPMSLLIWDAINHSLGVNAVNFAIHTTGVLAVMCLLLSLVITPLRDITGATWLLQFRRSLGVYGFYYAAAHLAIYFWWDRQRSLSSTAYEITHRYYLMIGFSSLALMTPLWATSFNAAIQWMGGKRWKQLHRFAYLAAALACYHFYLQSKADKRLPDVSIAVLALLLLWRVVGAVIHRARTPAIVGTAVTTGAKARFWKGQLRVIGMFRETAAVRTFRLAADDGGPIPFTFHAGQFLNLTVDVDGKRVGRSYTIASPPTRDAYVELTIKREDNGQVSKFLHDRMMTGGTIAVTAPAGRFTFEPRLSKAKVVTGSEGRNVVMPMDEEPGVLLVAGGVGITPVMSILRDLTDQCWPGKIDLIFSVRELTDVIFADELRTLAARHQNVRVHVTLTRDIPADWSGPRGRITSDLLRELVHDLAARPAFVCGPNAMANRIREELIAAGVPANRITLESFSPNAAVANDAGMPADLAMARSEMVNVGFAKSGKTAMLTGNSTILDAAESVGVNIDYQCRSGVCGTCKTKLVSGQVMMEVRDALSDADEAEGFFLPCQAHATEDIVVDA